MFSKERGEEKMKKNNTGRLEGKNVIIKYVSIAIVISLLAFFTILSILFFAVILFLNIYCSLTKKELNIFNLSEKQWLINSIIYLSLYFIPLPGYFDWAWLLSTKVWIPLRLIIIVSLVIISFKFIFRKIKSNNDKTHFLIWSSFIIYAITVALGSLIMYLLGFSPAQP